MVIGLRAHDAAYAPFDELVPNIKAQGFDCIHIALSKSIKEFTPDIAAMTPAFAMHMKRVCAKNDLDVAVLGCYLNLCNPDPVQHKEIVDKYTAHLRFASMLGCGVVGTETGACNTEYRFEPFSHTDEALKICIDNLAPVVETAEKFGVLMAIEPVWTHIVSTEDPARQLLHEIASPNLQIILDPVNLLHAEIVEDQDAMLREAFDQLGNEIAVVHMKDFVLQGDQKVPTAIGQGKLDYPYLCKLIKEKKPYIHCTLEETTPANAVASREYVQKTYAEA
ncbi:MAG: sugar phosphate isomerase/epimerase [Lachnospiraceae bacterium]|nr:sugar phosphate isomerase/epimerase [Lachnospiraceae bacterium]